MDQLRGPTIQIILHVKEGVGFGFLKAPFIVSGSLNGYILETDPTVPCHTPLFDAELVWEANKRRFRSLRVQNVPIKVEVFTTGTQGSKNKVGYLLLSLLGAQPCPSSKVVELKHTWHKLLGVKAEGKCCQPQLMLSLSIEDRINTLTPRNELRLFHSNEVAYPPTYPGSNPPPGRAVLMTLREYLTESKRTVSSTELTPKLICDEGLIQIGHGKQMFILSFVIGAVENVHTLLPDHQKDPTDCYIMYSIFTHDVMTDRVSTSACGDGCSAIFNQRTSLRLRTDLASLAAYFAECPHIVTRLCAADKDIGVCSLELRKLIPTSDLEEFLRLFCNEDKTLSIQERCFMLRCEEKPSAKIDNRRPYIDIEMSLKYVGEHQENVQKAQMLTARSVTQLERTQGQVRSELAVDVDYTSGSCTHLGRGQLADGYTALAVTNTARFKTATGDSMLQTNELTDLIKKMYDSFTLSQEKILLHTVKPSTNDAQIQCESENTDKGKQMQDIDKKNLVQEEPLTARPPNDDDHDKTYGMYFSTEGPLTARQKTDHDNKKYNLEKEPLTARPKDNGPYKTYEKKLDGDRKIETSRSDTCVLNNKNELPQSTVSEFITSAVSVNERRNLMQKMVNELEDWKERQQEMFKVQLKRKEEYHLELLAEEWSKKRSELESKLSRGIEQCRTLAADLSRATEDFRLRGYRNTERERKLIEAKKALESHYTAKYQELREASQKMEAEMQHQLQMKEMRIEELQTKLSMIEKEMELLRDSVKNREKELERKYSGLTKDQTASLIQELRCLEEKLEGAVQSKAFFKEQWGRAVRELHLAKLGNRAHLLDTLRHQRHQLGLGDIEGAENRSQSQVDLNKLNSEFYVDILASTPPQIESHSMISTSGPDVMEMYEELKISSKNPLNDKLSELIAQRDSLIQQDNPNEEVLKQLNSEIRNMLLNCGT